jgi:hypothetical protein
MQLRPAIVTVSGREQPARRFVQAVTRRARAPRSENCFDAAPIGAARRQASDIPPAAARKLVGGKRIIRSGAAIASTRAAQI